MTLENIFPFLKTNYNSREDDIIEDIYVPCFKLSNRYYRGTAYFRSSVLDLYRTSVLDFCKNDPDAKISILTSTEVMPVDAIDILHGYSLRDLELTLESLLSDESTKKATKFLCALIASKKLDIHVIKGPLYHDKVGFFSDKNNNFVAFTGSGNETVPGVSKNSNFERYVVSWSGNEGFSSYGETWVKELTDAVDYGKYVDAEIYRFDELSEYFMERFQIEKEISNLTDLFQPDFHYFNYDLLSENGPQKHQLEAFHGWKNNSERALFEHATGTYKTASGLMCADYFLQKQNYVVISAPLIIIAENWSNLIKKCFDNKIELIQCWSDYGNWDILGSEAINAGKKIIFVFVNASLWSPKGRDFLRILKNKFLLIADEAHNWEKSGSVDFIEKFEPLARLALTAKLSEPGLENNCRHVLEYFANGKDIFIHNLDLDYAISRGFLREYEYNLIKITLDIPNITNDTPSLFAISIWSEFEEKKREYTPELCNNLLDSKNRVLAYTGPTKELAQEMYREMQRIWLQQQTSPSFFKKITSDESSKERKMIINDFTNGNTRALVAIKVLDEGVDLPISDAAIMAISNEKYRTWIQRRGRILRKKNPVDDSNAVVIDFILDLTNLDHEVVQILRRKYSSEISRVIEFSSSSISGIIPAKNILEETGWC